MRFDMRSPFLSASALWLLATNIGFAQTDVATVLGTITDASGAVVPQAKLLLENMRTGVSASALSDGNGLYHFLDVRIGEYRVSAGAAGFKTVTTEPFTLTVAARQRVDISLQLGESSTTVTVNDAAAIIETDSSNRGHVVQHETIVDLPLNGRNYADLALLAPGVRVPLWATSPIATRLTTSMACARHSTASSWTDWTITRTAPAIRASLTK